MKLDAILHIPMSEYCHGLDETHIVYRLRCAKNDLQAVTLYYGDTACRVTPIIFTPAPMEKVASDALHDYWQVIVDSPFDRVYYYFDMYDGAQSLLHYGHLFTDHLVDDRSQYFKLPINHRSDIAKVPDWVHDAVVYNIFPDSFATSRRHISGMPLTVDYQGRPVSSKLGGTLWGVAENVDYLKELGVNCVYLNPIFAAGEYHKYDLLDYYHVDPCFGGDEAFHHLVKVFHENGIRIIIDGVFNHCGWYFFAFDDVVNDQEKSRYRHWFYRLRSPVERPAQPEAYPTYACFAYERMMPKLDTSQPEVRAYFCNVGRFWVKEFDIDGWRLDVASEVDDTFWRAFRQAVKAEKPDALLIGEVWETAAHWLQGDMFDSTMNYDLRKHSELFFAQGAIDAVGFSGRISHMLMRYKVQTVPAQLNLLDSHDVSRFLTLCGGDRRRYRLAVLFQMTFVGMPTVFYGDELGLQGYHEHEYRCPMPWGAGDHALHGFFKEAIAMRHALPALRRGDFRMLDAQGSPFLLAFARRHRGQTVTVCINAGAAPAPLPAISSQPYWADGLENGVLGPLGFAVFVDGEPSRE